VIAFVSWLSLVFGELVPKSLALRYSQGYALAIGPWLLRLSRWFRPLVWFLTACSNLVLRPFGDRTNFTEARVSRDELRELVEHAAVTGSVDPQTSSIAARAIGFEDVRVGELMVARADVIALDVHASVGEIKRIITEEGHSRMPVYRDDPRQVIGYVVARDLLAMAWDQRLLVLHDLVRPAFVAPATARAIDVLRELQRRRVQLAIVTDEQGSWVGIVTIEDLIEEMVGDIFNEDDDDVIVLAGDGTALVPATVQVRRVNRVLGLALPTSEEHTTLGGVCLALADGIPATGARLTAPDGTVLEVVEASPRRVRTVRLHPAA
jgi:putative hemolysin